MCSMTNSALAARFAAGMHPTGRTGNGTFYYNGDKLYSYGSHYVVDHKFHTDNGIVVVVNRTRYSNTTSRHCREADRAISDKFGRWNVISVDGLNTLGTGKAINMALAEELECLKKKQARARKPSRYDLQIAFVEGEKEKCEKLLNLGGKW